MRSTGFTVAEHGYAFANGFVTRPIPFAPQIAFPGLCGGMTFSALDYFHHGLPIPPHQTGDFAHSAGVPPSGSRLERWIRARQIDSVNPFVTPTARKYFTWAVKSRESARLATQAEGIEAAMALIDFGSPAALGLVADSRIPTQSHQVAAYAYQIDPASGSIDLFIYENNRPGQTVKLTARCDAPLIAESAWDGTSFRPFRSWKRVLRSRLSLQTASVHDRSGRRALRRRLGAGLVGGDAVSY